MYSDENVRGGKTGCEPLAFKMEALLAVLFFGEARPASFCKCLAVVLSVLFESSILRGSLKTSMLLRMCRSKCLLLVVGLEARFRQ